MPANSTATIAIVTPVIAATNYSISPQDTLIAVGSIPAGGTRLVLPAQPSNGDTYEFSDVDGTCAGATPIILDGNGHSIRGGATLAFTGRFASVMVSFVASLGIWAIIATSLGGGGGGGPVNSVNALAPIASSGGANPQISIAPATDFTAGSLSAADKLKLDGILVPAAPIGLGTVVALDNQSGVTMFAGINAATWAYTPVSSGLVEVNLAYSFSAAAICSDAIILVIFTGGVVGAGTVLNGVHYLQGSTPTRAGGVLQSEPIFQNGASSGAAVPLVFQGGASSTILAQLVAGTNYTFAALITSSGAVASAPNHTNMTLSANCFELR